MKFSITILTSTALFLVVMLNTSCKKEHDLLATVIAHKDSVSTLVPEAKVPTVPLEPPASPTWQNEIVIDTVWNRGDVYGLAINDIFLASPELPILFTNNSFGLRSCEVFIKIDSAWLPVPRVWQTQTNAPFHYDATFSTIWIISFPGDESLVGKKSSIKIKF